MGKINDFDLDLKVKEGTKKGVEPAIRSFILCTPGCITGSIKCGWTTGGCK